VNDDNDVDDADDADVIVVVCHFALSAAAETQSGEGGRSDW